MFLACPKSKETIKLKFYYSNLKNAVETAKIAVDSCYVLRQFLTSLPSIDFREIRGLLMVYPNIMPSCVLLSSNRHNCSIIFLPICPTRAVAKNATAVYNRPGIWQESNLLLDNWPL